MSNAASSRITVYVEDTQGTPALFSGRVEPGGTVEFVSLTVQDSAVEFPEDGNPLVGDPSFKVPGNGESLKKTVGNVAAEKYPFTLTTPGGATHHLLLEVGDEEVHTIGFAVDAQSQVVLQVHVKKSPDPLLVSLKNDLDSVQRVLLLPERDIAQPFETLLASVGRSLPLEVPIDQLGRALLLRLSHEPFHEAGPMQAGGTDQAEIIVDPDT